MRALTEVLSNSARQRQIESVLRRYQICFDDDRRNGVKVMEPRPGPRRQDPWWWRCERSQWLEPPPSPLPPSSADALRRFRREQRRRRARLLVQFRRVDECKRRLQSGTGHGGSFADLGAEEGKLDVLLIRARAMSL
jgi:hypothetical protein